MSQYGGIYRAEVVGIEDPERRHRVQVLVERVHAQSRDHETCPWAVTCSLGGKGAGMFFSHRIGDLVWVMFEDGNADSPVIVGAQNTESMGVSDEPIDKQTDYAEGRRRWSQVDRKGNLIEMSEVGDEMYVRMKAGGAEVRVTQMGDEVIISSPSGKVRVDSMQADVTAGSVTVKGATVDIEGEDFNTLGLDSGAARMSANGRVEINAQDARTGTLGTLDLGGCARRFLGLPLPLGTPGVNSIPKQTPTTNLRGRTVNIGGGVGAAVPVPLPCGVGTPPLPTDPGVDGQMDFDGLTVLKPTVTVNIRAQARININAGDAVYVQSQGNTVVKSLAGIVQVSAPVIQVSATAVLTLESVATVVIKGAAVNIQTGV